MTFTWQGTAPRPKAVVIVETCEVSGSVFTGQVSVDNFFGDTVTTTQTSSPPRIEKEAGKSGVTLIKHYWVKHSPAAAFTIRKASPSVSAVSTSLAASGSLWYTAEALPLDIQFTDGNGTGVANARQYIIGQNVKAELVSPLPVDEDTREWTAVGGSPFASYQRSQQSATLNLLPSPNRAEQFSGYYAKPLSNAQIKAKGELVVTAPHVVIENGVEFDILREVEIKQPVFTNLIEQVGWQGGYPTETAATLLTASGLTLTDPQHSPPAVVDVGFHCSANLSSSGKFYFVQKIVLSRTRTGASGSESLEIPLGNPPTEYFTAGLDAVFPGAPSAGGTFTGGYYTTQNTRFYFYDGPGQGFEDAANWSSYSINDESFEVWLMYQPPGSESQDVPIRRWQWKWNCTGTKSGSLWTAFRTNMSTPAVTSIDAVAHPEWSKVVNVASGVWR